MILNRQQQEAVLRALCPWPPITEAATASLIKDMAERWGTTSDRETFERQLFDHLSLGRALRARLAVSVLRRLRRDARVVPYTALEIANELRRRRDTKAAGERGRAQ